MVFSVASDGNASAAPYSCTAGPQDWTPGAGPTRSPSPSPGRQRAVPSERTHYLEEGKRRRGGEEGSRTGEIAGEGVRKRGEQEEREAGRRSRRRGEVERGAGGAGDGARSRGEQD